MRRRLLFPVLLSAMLLFTTFASGPRIAAQDGEYRCDEGPNDVVEAARAAFEAGDLETAQDLIVLAEQLCARVPDRLPIVRVLAGRIDQALNPQQPTQVPEVPEIMRPDPQMVLSEPGPYFVGRQSQQFVDANRSNREVLAEVWYPALAPDQESLPAETLAEYGESGMPDAEPDLTNAPYPLVIFSHGLVVSHLRNPELLAHLSSFGFIVASVAHGEDCDTRPTCIIDRPMDVVFVLNELVENTDEHLVGLIDETRIGVMGEYGGTWSALMSAGARIDENYFFDWYATRDNRYTSLDELSFYYAEGGTTVERWDEIAGYMAQYYDLKENELWPSVEDDRIRAVFVIMPVAPMLYGEHGLASVTEPTMILATTHDFKVSYDREIVPLFSRLGATDSYLITMLRFNQDPGRYPIAQSYYRHFSVAFFAVYLQNDKRFREYMSQEFVDRNNHLVWGVYEGR